MYLLGIAAIVAFGYRTLVTIPFDSWLDFLGVGVWALFPWWITAGIAARMGGGPCEIAAKLHAPGHHP